MPEKSGAKKWCRAPPEVSLSIDSDSSLSNAASMANMSTLHWVGALASAQARPAGSTQPTRDRHVRSMASMAQVSVAAHLISAVTSSR